jgi:hypothetical protein
MIVKILGGIDLMASFAFLMLTFGISPDLNFTLFCSGLLFIKSLFVFKGELVLSSIDLISSLLLFISLFFSLPIIFLWTPSLLLLAKGFVSFI